MQDRLLQGGGVPGPRRHPRARPDPARRHRANPAALDPEADVRELLDDTDDDLPAGFERVSVWQFAGVGYLDLPTAAAAVESATRTRCR